MMIMMITMMNKYTLVDTQFSGFGHSIFRFWPFNFPVFLKLIYFQIFQQISKRNLFKICLNLILNNFSKFQISKKIIENSLKSLFFLKFEILKNYLKLSLNKF